MLSGKPALLKLKKGTCRFTSRHIYDDQAPVGLIAISDGTSKELMYKQGKTSCPVTPGTSTRSNREAELLSLPNTR